VVRNRLANPAAAAYRRRMVVALQPILLGVISYVLIAFSPLVLIWLGLRLAKIIDAVRDRRAAHQRAASPPGQPLERLAADLRRLRAELTSGAPTNNLRHTALHMAYDSVLLDTCASLRIPTELATAAGPDRDLERLRAEAAIQDAGVQLHTPHRRAQP